MTNIVIADKQFLTNEALKYVLSTHYKIIDTVYTKNDLLKCLELNPVSLLIIDPVLLNLECPADLIKLKQKHLHLRILIFTNTTSKIKLAELSNTDIKNVLLKTADKNELFQAIEATLNGKRYYSSEITGTLIKKNTDSENSVQLTTSEIEIVRLIGGGLTTKEIAARKFISFHTVMTHRKNIFRKLGVSNTSELLMYAIKAGLIDNIEYYI
ncbi:MAG: response regulator transcription factor [Chlorobiales bacterium]|jgi:DNA-binding NarL/FixJ family response regulator|nr:response regulator transcription factor [Chlorobiales bacterium]